MACPHVSEANLKPPTPSQPVYREDCTQCFDSIDNEAGLDVCLSCFNGGCSSERNHAQLHYALTEHPLVLNIKRTRKPKVERDEPPQKMSKLAIAAEVESDYYDTTTQVKCYVCPNDEVDRTSGNLPAVIDGVLTAMSFSRQTEVKAWEQEISSCEHVLCLQQDPAKSKDELNLSKCADCNLTENLWMCLQCGNLGCGRAQFGGVGGNGHGVAHYETSKHPVSLKLGSITPDGTADVYCYQCNDEMMDPEVAAHLAHWHINIAERQKTEKSLTEMQIEQNLKWEFNMTSEDGKELRPLFGPGLTGLKNLGNSCYLASILQCLFSLPQFRERYYDVREDLPITLEPAQDLETQLRKVADGLLSGRYSVPEVPLSGTDSESAIHYQRGLAPSMLKALVGKGHEEFSTMRQQDAFELLLHLLKLITRSPHQAPLKDPVSAFRFVMEQRLQCLSCKKVRYRTDEQDNISVPVPVRRIKNESSMDEDNTKKEEKFESVTLRECLDIFTSDEHIEYSCKACGAKDGAVKKTMFKTFPAVLAVNARRFELVNWVPTKLDVPLVVEDSLFSLDKYLSKGQGEDEELLPDDSDNSSAKPSFEPNAGAMSQLEGMGFPQPRCIKALYHTGNVDAETAMNWLFSHMEDVDIDEPLVISDSGSSSAAVVQADPEHIVMLTSMGFTELQAKKALRETGGNVERAVEWVFNHPDDMGLEEPGSAVDSGTASGSQAKETPGDASLPANFQLQSIVCHKGSSIHAGHYVAFIRKQVPGIETENKETWVLFNDEKVVEGADVEEMKKFAYVYMFERVGA